MKTLWCKNKKNPSDRISHAWAPLSVSRESFYCNCLMCLKGVGHDTEFIYTKTNIYMFKLEPLMIF
jgi:hypothetical protein